MLQSTPRRFGVWPFVAIVIVVVAVGYLLWVWHPPCLLRPLTGRHPPPWVPTAWLVEDLQAKDPRTRSRATLALNHRADASNAVGMFSPLLQDPDEYVRKWALNGLSLVRQRHGSLAGMPDAELVERLADVFRHDASLKIRSFAGSVLLTLGKDFFTDEDLRA